MVMVFFYSRHQTPLFDSSLSFNKERPKRDGTSGFGGRARWPNRTASAGELAMIRRSDSEQPNSGVIQVYFYLV